ncbi:hypothetical protein B0T09DRAFT_298276 [Sordaria sp. MPI-SDFR-AT-0083]|nr:hypothetical protein B0T09DRAFT_298276 [Sordaria sp. MPI-SDFR-AT-0083]
MSDLERRGEAPGLPFDPKTTMYCTYWYDNDGSLDCEWVPDSWSIEMKDFLRWNPSLTANCGNFIEGRSYCVEAYGEPAGGVEPPAVTGGPSTPSTSTVPATTTTAPAGNGITTPLPIQPGMVSDCDSFYFVKLGDSCTTIAASNGISLTQFTTWNPQVGGASCSGLWANAYVCVSTIGHSPSVSTTVPAAIPTTTAPSNGINTPTPIQPGMVGNCDAFYLPATTTTAGNGIATPTNIQPGMVNNCDDFYLVKSGDSCVSIAAAKGITVAQFSTWNSKVGSTCTGLWADTYACVSIVGHTPTTGTSPVSTPSPIQSGMVSGCKKFHFVQAGETCDTIASKYGVTTANFKKWNPAVKSDCTGMWANTYACVGV